MLVVLDSLDLATAERKLCSEALHAAGSIVEAANLLGITRHALKRRIVKHRIAWPPPNHVHVASSVSTEHATPLSNGYRPTVLSENAVNPHINPSLHTIPKTPGIAPVTNIGDRTEGMMVASSPTGGAAMETSSVVARDISVRAY